MNLVVKKKWFDKIKSGEKTHEYRVLKEYWIKRFSKLFVDPNATYMLMKSVQYFEFFPIEQSVTFTCGYAKKSDKDKRIDAKIQKITIRNGKDTDLQYNNLVFDLEFTLCQD